MPGIQACQIALAGHHSELQLESRKCSRTVSKATSACVHHSLDQLHMLVDDMRGSLKLHQLIQPQPAGRRQEI